MTTLGIDPGKSGGYVVLGGTEGTEESVPFIVQKFTTMEDFVSSMDRIRRSLNRLDLILIEKVHSMPQQGVKTTFTFGENFGFLQGVVMALFPEVPIHLVPPQKWQSFLGIEKSAKKTEHKNKLKMNCQSRWPKQNWTLATADAALIALHGQLRAKNYI